MFRTIDVNLYCDVRAVGVLVAAAVVLHGCACYVGCRNITSSIASLQQQVQRHMEQKIDEHQKQTTTWTYTLADSGDSSDSSDSFHAVVRASAA